MQTYNISLISEYALISTQSKTLLIGTLLCHLIWSYSWPVIFNILPAK